MKALLERYLNEIVGLTIMALMVLALVGGQADADIRKGAAAQDLGGIAKIEIHVSDR
jgi:hypothetical protein